MSRTPLTPGEARFLSYRAAGDLEHFPPPPYQVGDAHLQFIGVRFAPGVASALLTPDLAPRGNDAGLICVYTVGSGWAAPFSACYAAVEVAGFDAPDGSSGYYIAAGYYSGRGAALMQRYYNLNVLDGGSRQFVEGEVGVGVGGPVGEDVLTVRLRPDPAPQPSIAGIHHYLGASPDGGSSIFPIAFSGISRDAEPLSVEISDRASERMQLARPVELRYAIDLTDFSLTFAVPQPVARANLTATTSQASLLDGFFRLGRAAVLVSAGGEVGIVSAGARALLGDGLSVAGGRLRVSRPTDQKLLDRLIAAAAAGDAVNPIALLRAEGQPLLIDALAIGPAATGAPSVLVLINDPASPASGNATASLQLLGLTPAEARIAGLVGSGLSPREAAAQLDNTEGTVRTSLIRIYQKLGIGRQAELARIVARL